MAPKRQLHRFSFSRLQEFVIQPLELVQIERDVLVPHRRVGFLLQLGEIGHRDAFLAASDVVCDRVAGFQLMPGARRQLIRGRTPALSGRQCLALGVDILGDELPFHEILQGQTVVLDVVAIFLIQRLKLVVLTVEPQRYRLAHKTALEWLQTA